MLLVGSFGCLSCVFMTYKRVGVATLWSEPIRAQYLDGCGPMRGLYSVLSLKLNISWLGMTEWLHCGGKEWSLTVLRRGVLSLITDLILVIIFSTAEERVHFIRRNWLPLHFWIKASSMQSPAFCTRKRQEMPLVESFGCLEPLPSVISFEINYLN